MLEGQKAAGVRVTKAKTFLFPNFLVNFLLHPAAPDVIEQPETNIPTIVSAKPGPTPRTATAIGLIVGYLIFLILMGASFFRLVYTVLQNPGFTPLGPNAYGRSGEGKESWVPPAAVGARNEKDVVSRDPNRDIKTSGMFITNVQMLWWGCTTLENFDRRTKRYFVARLDPDQDPVPKPRRTTTLNPRTTGRGAQSQPFWQHADETRDVDAGFQRRVLLPIPSPEQLPTPQSTSTASTDQPRKNSAPPVPRRFYRLYLTPSGLHPWRIGFKRNFKQVLGPRLWDWLLPTYRPYHRPRSRDDGDLAEGVWTSKQLWKQMNKEGWAAGERGAAMAREGGVNRWYDFSDEFIRFLDSCD
ncbi:hypothetical protein ABW19_dt0205803 [Dactylella cylindrospora]|nr:hypothetical protein ABW19_dt0205803 [Dactylella cylindrospora]